MNAKALVVALAALAAGAGGGYWYAVRQHQAAAPAGEAGGQEGRKILFYRHPMNPSITSPVPAKDEMGMDYIPVYADEAQPKKKERKILFYRHPMNPSITSPVPAKDEMGMDYIPVYADEGEGGDEPAGTVKIDPVVVQNIGVRTARAEHRTLARRIVTVGRVDYDERRISRVSPKISGWVERLHVSETGQPVERGQVLLEVYAPRIVASAEEYLLALENRDVLGRSVYPEIRETAERLVASARERLRLLDVPADEIRRIERTRKVRRTVPLRAPASGIVTRIGVREGQHISPGKVLYEIADLSRVWVYADLFEQDLPWVRVGDEAELRLRALPGRVFRGRIAYIYPYAESRTRTVRVRLEFDNPGLALKPDMYATVHVLASRRERALAIPEEAIVRTGVREQVFVAREGGKFVPREVRLGLAADGWVEVLEGLRPGERVVTSAQFLIDSESKIREAAAKMLEPEVADEGGTGAHEGGGDGAPASKGGGHGSGHEAGGHDGGAAGAGQGEGGR